MTTFTGAHADVRTSNVRAEARSHRHPARGLRLRNPLWLLFVLLVFAVGVGGLFVVGLTLGATASTVPQPI